MPEGSTGLAELVDGRANVQRDIHREPVGDEDEGDAHAVGALVA